jgi:hypothetical protein
MTTPPVNTITGQPFFSDKDKMVLISEEFGGVWCPESLNGVYVIPCGPMMFVYDARSDRAFLGPAPRDVVKVPPEMIGFFKPVITFAQTHYNLSRP